MLWKIRGTAALECALVKMVPVVVLKGSDDNSQSWQEERRTFQMVHVLLNLTEEVGSVS